MDYSKMTDFEINCAVARAAGIAGMLFFDVDSSFCHGPVWNVPSGITEGGINISRGNPFTPCATAADAWPIILEHGISVAFDKNEDEWVAWGDFAFDLAGWDMKEQPAEYEHHVNPLRAAMLVFLMMQEAK